jgi:hypothetical protein
MAQLEHVDFGKTNAPDAFSDKLSREGSLLAAVPHNFVDGLKARAEDAWDHKLETGAEVLGSAALGFGLAVALKNPDAAAFAKYLPWVGGALVAGDATKRLGAPVLDTWNNPNNLAADKIKLGANLGAMTFDYAVMGASGAGGALGARLAPGLAGGISSETATFGRELPRMQNIGPADMPVFKAELPAGITAESRAAFSQAITDKLFATNFADLTTMTTTKHFSLPLGTSMGLGVASAADIVRPRDNTNLGALTQISPLRANFNESFKQLRSNTDELFERIDTKRGIYLNKSADWLNEHADKK